MYYLYGRDEIIQNVYRLSRAGSTDPVDSLDSLRRQYLRFLSGPRFEAPVNHGIDVFVTDPRMEAAIAGAYSGGNLNDMDQATIIGEPFSQGERSRRIEQVRAAVDRLPELDAGLASVFDLLIHSIFIRKTNRARSGFAAHGGSSSNAIGSIWLSVNDDLTKGELTELLIHELTHHAIFVDEYCHYHFDYDLIADPANFALSAIRKTMRPLDKVVHSIVVSVELVSARQQALRVGQDLGTSRVHPDTPTTIQNAIAACDSVLDLANLDELVSARTVDLVDRSRSFCFEHSVTPISEAMA